MVDVCGEQVSQGQGVRQCPKDCSLLLWSFTMRSEGREVPSRSSVLPSILDSYASPAGFSKVSGSLSLGVLFIITMHLELMEYINA